MIKRNLLRRGYRWEAATTDNGIEASTKDLQRRQEEREVFAAKGKTLRLLGGLTGCQMFLLDGAGRTKIVSTEMDGTDTLEVYRIDEGEKGQ